MQVSIWEQNHGLWYLRLELNVSHCEAGLDGFVIVFLSRK